MQLVEDGHPASADDRDQTVDPFRVKLLEQLVGQVCLFDHVVFVDRADVERIDEGRLAEDAPGVRVEVLRELPG